MLYRKFGQLNVSVLCFGTATFVAGKFNPDADSDLGIRSLELALDKGVNFIHSSTDLSTQWALRQVLAKHSLRNEIHHMVKIKAPDSAENTFDSGSFAQRVDLALSELATDRISVIEHMIITKPKTDGMYFKHVPNAFHEVRSAFNKLKAQGKVEMLLIMVDNPLQMRAAIDLGAYDGLSCYFNLADSWGASFFQEISKQNKSFIGIRSLNRGILTDDSYHGELAESDGELFRRLSRLKGIGVWSGEPLQCFAVRFGLAHPVVKSLVVSMGQPAHVTELIKAIEQPLAFEKFRVIV